MTTARIRVRATSSGTRRMALFTLWAMLASSLGVISADVARADETASWPMVVSRNYSAVQTTRDGGVVAAECNGIHSFADALVGSYSPTGSLRYQSFGSEATAWENKACGESIVTRTGAVITYGFLGETVEGVVRASNAGGTMWTHAATSCDGQFARSLESAPRYAPAFDTVSYLISGNCYGTPLTLVVLDASTGTVKFRAAGGTRGGDVLDYNAGYVYFKYPNEFVYLNSFGQKDAGKSFTVDTTYERRWAVTADGTVATMARSGGSPCESTERSVTFHPVGGSSFVRTLPNNPACPRIDRFKITPSGDAVFYDKVDGVGKMYIVPQSASRPVVASPLSFPSGNGQPDGNFLISGNVVVDVYGNIVVHGTYAPIDGGPTQVAVLMYGPGGDLRKTFTTESLSQPENQFSVQRQSVALARGHIYIVLMSAGTRVLHKIPFAGVGVDYPRGALLGVPPGMRNYVALGDSFSSGEGVEPFEAGTAEAGENECHRSEKSYARMLSEDPALMLDLGRDGFRACSGAETKHINDVEKVAGEPAQHTHLGSDTDIVSLTIGGNDIGFSDFATACVVGVCRIGSPAYDTAFDKVNNVLPTALRTTYEKVLAKTTGSSADVYVLGYPQIAPQDKTPGDLPDLRCPYFYESGADPGSGSTAPYRWMDAVAAQDLVGRINSHIERTIWDMRARGGENLRLHYVEVNNPGSPFEGHQVCSSGDSYFHNLDQYPGHPAYAFHPNAKGQAAYAELLKTSIAETRCSGKACAYHPLAPSRLVDTRASSPVAGGQSISVQVTGRGGVPSSGVGAAVVNLTGTAPTAGTFVTAYPTGEARPLASTLNLTAGQTAPNLTVLKVGAGGQVSLYNNSGSVHLIADVVGWFPTGADYTALTPARVLDTRATGPVRGSQSLELQVTGRSGIPADGVGAVVLNLTGTQPTASTFITAYPAGEVRPLASTLNLTPGQTVPNLAIVKVGAGGKIALYNNSGSTHLIADIVGWFPTGSDYSSLTPARALDTRSTAPVAAGQSLQLQVTGQGGVPANGVGAVVLNLTGTQPTASTFITAYPAGEVRPLASTLNLTPGQTVPNLAIVKVGAGGKIALYNNSGSTHLIADIVGWFPAAE